MERRTNQISRHEVLDLGEYDRLRDSIRTKAMAARGARRIALGPNATLAFENRETVLYQIQEMLRAERISRERDVQHEIETYSDLLPSSDELSATMMLEFPDEVSRAVHLRDLVGFEEHLRLVVDGAGTSKARFDQRQLDVEQISAVQFVRFALDEAQRESILRGARVRVVCDHPRYSYSVELPESALGALRSDLEAALV